MWTREELKLKARKNLSKNYWNLFGVEVFLILFLLLTLALTYQKNFSLLIIGFLFCILLVAPLAVGVINYYINSIDDKHKFNEIFKGFQENYFNIMIANLLVTIYTILWSLLLVIPGIIKAYSYSMVPYILAENPDMDYHEVIRLSCKMTKGHKWNMFILQLSFIGWSLLGLMAFGIGIIFVAPYIESTYVQLYFKLKEDFKNDQGNKIIE